MDKRAIDEKGKEENCPNFIHKNHPLNSNLFSGYAPTNEVTSNKTQKFPRTNRKTKTMISQENNNFLHELILEITSHKGSKYYQKKVSNDPIFTNTYLYSILRPNLLMLIKDPQGNFFFSKFIESLDRNNLQHFMEFVVEHFEELIFHPYGSKVIIKLFERYVFINKSDEESLKKYQKILNQIRGNVCKLSQNENSSAAIQKLMMLTNHLNMDFIFEEIYQSFHILSTSQTGSCVVQKYLVYGNKSQIQIMTNLILQNISRLISDQYGNYVVQSMILTSENWVISALFGIISRDAVKLCKEKYSSNVIEKLFEINNLRLVNEIAKCLLQNERVILELLCDHYGNYIIQKILFTISDVPLTNKIVNVISRNLNIIANFSFGNQFIMKVKAKFPFLK